MKHYEEIISIDAAMEEVFAFVDDRRSFSSHMSKSSWMMGGGHMDVEVDEKGGYEVGSRVRLRGKVFGIMHSVEELITQYRPLAAKSWEKTG